MKTCLASLSDRALLDALTRAHNAYQAELDYGRDFIERARRLG
jgi:hypothetical protein